MLWGSTEILMALRSVGVAGQSGRAWGRQAGLNSVPLHLTGNLGLELSNLCPRSETGGTPCKGQMRLGTEVQ